MKELIEGLRSYSWPKDNEPPPRKWGVTIDQAIEALKKWRWAAPDAQAPNPLPDHVELNKYKEPE